MFILVKMFILRPFEVVFIFEIFEIFAA